MKGYKIVLALAVFATFGGIYLFFRDSSKVIIPDQIKKPTEQEFKLVNHVWDNFKTSKKDEKLTPKSQKILFDKLITLKPIMRTHYLKGFPLTIDMYFRCLVPFHFRGDVDISVNAGNQIFKAKKDSFIHIIIQKKRSMFSIKPYWFESTESLYRITNHQLKEGEHKIRLTLKILMKGRLDKTSSKKLIATKEYNYDFKIKVVSKLPKGYVKKVSSPKLDQAMQLTVQDHPKKVVMRTKSGKFFNHMTIKSINPVLENLSYRVRVLEKEKIVNEFDMLIKKRNVGFEYSFPPYKASFDPEVGQRKIKVILEPSSEVLLKNTSTLTSFWNKRIEKEAQVKVYQRIK